MVEVALEYRAQLRDFIKDSRIILNLNRKPDRSPRGRTVALPRQKDDHDQLEVLRPTNIQI
jgi:hypothetical protein